jgi:DNA-binding NtrC family response regulator
MAKVLLIDDEPDLLSAMAEVLAAEGHQVTALSNGLALFEGDLEIDFDLVVTDIIMPGVEGLEIVAHLQKQKPRLNVIAISGGGRIEPSFHLRLAQQMGARETLQKPFRLKTLAETVDRILGDRSFMRKGFPMTGKPSPCTVSGRPEVRRTLSAGCRDRASRARSAPLMPPGRKTSLNKRSTASPRSSTAMAEGASGA